jgi:hypothetical protein
MILHVPSTRRWVKSPPARLTLVAQNLTETCETRTISGC